MPEAFLRCARTPGAKVRTISLPNNKYQKICVIGGKKYYGHVETKAETKKKAE